MNRKEMEERLKRAYKRREQERREQDSKTVVSIEDKVLLKKGEFTVVRVLDVPQPVYFSFIKGDDDKLHLIKFPDPNNKGNFILYKICDTVMESVFKGRDRNGESIFEYPMKESHPEIFNMVFNNGSHTIGKYGPNGWVQRNGRPQTACYINVINRQAFSAVKSDEKGEEEEINYGANWCYENNHSLLLAKSEKSIGAPITINNILMDSLMDNFGTFFNYDIAIKRLSGDPWYEVFKADTLSGKQEVQECLKSGNLTEEDEKLELYDTVEMSKETQPSLIYKFLKGKIEMIDRELDTNFLEQLEKQVDQETETTPSSYKKTEKEEDQEEKQEEKKEEAIPRRRSSSESSGGSSDMESVAPYVKDLCEDDRKKYIKGVGSDGNLEFTTEELIPCSNSKCNKPQPMELDKFCLYCGQKFDS